MLILFTKNNNKKKATEVQSEVRKLSIGRPVRDSRTPIIYSPATSKKFGFPFYLSLLSLLISPLTSKRKCEKRDRIKCDRQNCVCFCHMRR
jgi:hypothetical protein